jgi:hypothetical protein
VSYTINIQGHKEGLGTDANASRDFEAKIEAKAREFVQSLEGVTVATFQGGNIGTRNLTEEGQASSPGSAQTSSAPPASDLDEQELRVGDEPSRSEAEQKRRDLR